MNQKIVWDPEIDAPATIAIIGCGPVAIEAALYARFLGYSVFVYERSRPAASLARFPRRDAGSRSECCSSLGLAALEAQETPCGLRTDQSMSVKEYVDQYLLPLARTDLLYDSINIQSEVCSVSRTCCDESLDKNQAAKAELEFRLLISSRKRGTYVQIADIVLDCSGLADRQGLASGGGKAVGELELVEQQNGYLSGLDDDAAGQLSATDHVVVWGDNREACETVLQLGEMLEQDKVAKVTWITPKRLSNSDLKFLGVPPETFEQCDQTASRLQPNFVRLHAWGVESIQRAEGQWNILCQTTDDETLELAGTVFVNFSDQRQDWSFWTGTPPSTLAFDDDAPELLNSAFTSEPHYYLLGSKSNRQLTSAEAREQIQQLFSVVGGRRDLDLYATIQPEG